MPILSQPGRDAPKSSRRSRPAAGLPLAPGSSWAVAPLPARMPAARCGSSPLRRCARTGSQRNCWRKSPLGARDRCGDSAPRGRGGSGCAENRALRSVTPAGRGHPPGRQGQRLERTCRIGRRCGGRPRGHAANARPTSERRLRGRIGPPCGVGDGAGRSVRGLPGPCGAGVRRCRQLGRRAARPLGLVHMDRAGRRAGVFRGRGGAIPVCAPARRLSWGRYSGFGNRGVRGGRCGLLRQAGCNLLDPVEPQSRGTFGDLALAPGRATGPRRLRRGRRAGR